jgi:hypothetical protein
MITQKLTIHTFDMNEYFSGQRFEIGGRDFDEEEKEAKREERTFDDYENTSQGRQTLRDIKEILRSLRKA